MNYTDGQLKQALAKMLPDVISCRKVIAHDSCKIVCLLQWGASWNDESEFMVRDTELLHLCWLVEDKLTSKEYGVYSAETYKSYSRIDANTIIYLWFTMPWQQRVEALAKVKGIEI